MATFKNPADLANAIVSEGAAKNKYNLIPTSEIRPVTQGSLSQEIGSLYNHLSDYYGVNLEDLVYGDTGFEKSVYPKGHPEFNGDIIYSDKLWNEFEKWAKKNKNIDFDDRRWERYKLDPDYFEGGSSPEEIQKVRTYGAKLEPNHEILTRPLPEKWY